MSADQWLAALRAEGITKIVQMPDWRTHNRNHKGAWGEVHGIVVHHTAGVGSWMADYCYSGTSSLPGPVCHEFLAKDGTLYLVGHGRANHAGTTTQNVYDSILREDMHPPRPSGAETLDGNRFLYGLEIENKGDGKDPYPAAQYDVAVRWAAARARVHGWTAGSVRGHKEITTRKIDPSFSMDTFRGDVEARLNGKDTDMTPDQSKKLDDLHKLLTPFAGWDYKSTGEGVPDKTRDAMGYLMAADKHAAEAVTLLKSGTPVQLTDAQVGVITNALAASPVLAEKIADLVAVKLAARLAK